MAMTQLQKVDLDEAAGSRPEYWSQQVVGEANGSLFKVAKGIHETVWHAHEDQDEAFVVTSGQLVVQLRSGDVTLGPGELIIIPRGVEHRPKADSEVRFLVVGPEITSNAAGGKPEWSCGSGAPPTIVS